MPEFSLMEAKRLSASLESLNSYLALMVGKL